MKLSLKWVDFKSHCLTLKGLAYQWIDVGSHYLIFCTDGVMAYDCSVAKTTPKSADQIDFEDNYQASGNQIVTVRTDPVGTTAQPIAVTRLATYSAEAALAGANDKDMLAIFNPAASGKVISVYEVWATVPSPSGTTVLVPFEIHKTSALTGGTDVTKQKWDSADAAAVAVVKHTPTGLTDAGVWYTFVEQTNTAQGSTQAQTETIHDGLKTSGLKPIVLREGEGLYLREIAKNTNTFRMGVLWTEE